MKSKIRIITTVLIVIGIVGIFTGCIPAVFFEKFEDKTNQEVNEEPIENIGQLFVNDSGKEDRIVYIQENGVPVPYVAVTDDYNGNALLMRKALTNEKVKYNETAIYGTSQNYYAESTIDKYLNNEFISRFSQAVQDAIPETEVEITSLDTINRGEFKRDTEFIKRKIFLLSATEIGIKGTAMTSLEGKSIAFFENYTNPGPQWLRSAYLWDDVHAWGIQTEGPDQENVTAEHQLRPVFTLPNDTALEVSQLDGENILMLTFDKNS